jgi:hypothetical protein
MIGCVLVLVDVVLEVLCVVCDPSASIPTVRYSISYLNTAAAIVARASEDPSSSLFIIGGIRKIPILVIIRVKIREEMGRTRRRTHLEGRSLEQVYP